VLYWFKSDWFNLYNLRPIFCDTLSTLLQSVLASSFPLRQDFSKRASFPIVCVEWFYEKDVWGVVKSWKFEGNLRCSKILRIRRKNPMKWVASISRDYWIYLDITCQSFKIWEFWGEFWGIETFHRSKFGPATGIMTYILNIYKYFEIFFVLLSWYSIGGCNANFSNLVRYLENPARISWYFSWTFLAEFLEIRTGEITW